MKLAVMQPYVFPYLGYFQLIANADRFVVLDDVNFITRGWIHRNRILGTGGPDMFTIPLHKASSNRRICDHEIAVEDRLWEKLPRILQRSYAKAPQFDTAWPLIESVLSCGETNLASFNLFALRAVLEFLGIRTPIVESSRVYGNDDLSFTARLVDICRREGADVYLNPEGGREIYSAEDFSPHGIELQFLVHEPAPYPQFGGPFEERLSIIDALIFNDRPALQKLLASFRIESASDSEALPGGVD